MDALKAIFAVSGLTVALVGLGGTAVAAASPSSTLTVQDQGSQDGADVRNGSEGSTDSDGTQGSYRPALDGTQSGPLMYATPQFKSTTN